MPSPVVAPSIQLMAVDRAAVVRVDLGRPDGPRVELGGLLLATARLHPADGRSLDQEVWCIGVGGQARAWCSE